MMALALLDGWGEEWAEIAAMVHNSVCVKPEHAKTAEDMRRFANLELVKEKPVEWDAIEARFQAMIMGPQHGR